MTTTAPQIFRGAPPDAPSDPIAWAEKYVRLVSSVRSERYDRTITPWTIEPILRCVEMAVRIVTLIKPIQTGGSSVGLIMLCWWLKFGFRQVQYNWEKDEKAEAKWEDETWPTLEACSELEGERIGGRFDAVKCKAMYRRSWVHSQGVWIPENLDSDSIPYQINEEVHSWKPGHLAKARGRQTAVTFPKALDISNAGRVGDQLHQAFENGTMQFWEVKCPECGNYHRMQTKWDDRRPELGGLRYDAEGCRLENGRYDYNKLEHTIRYQMPCGFQVRDTPSARRALSLSGRYCTATNEGAHTSHRSYNYDAVIVDYIPWLLLIKEKHDALRAMRNGDIAPLEKYTTERECRFWDPKDSNPLVGAIVVNSGQSKSRDGLKGRAARFYLLDRQKGLKIESEGRHWWLVIRDVMPNGDSQLVFEGKLYTEADVTGTLDEYECVRSQGAADMTWDTEYVTDFCFREGIHCFLSTDADTFSHGKEGRKIFSVEEPLHTYLNRPPKYGYIPGPDSKLVPDPREPMYWRVSKFGMMGRLAWLRAKTSAVKWDVPGDVSEDYKKQIDAWMFAKLKDNPRTGEAQYGYQQIYKHDHLHYCECGIAVLMEMAGLIGVAALEETQ